MRVILHGRHSIWRRWRVSAFAPRIVNDVLYVSRINHESHFSWQAQHLVMLQRHFSWPARGHAAVSCLTCVDSSMIRP